MRQNGVRPARFRFNKGGRAGAMGGGKMISGKARKDEASGFYSPDMGMKGGKMYKKGGRTELAEQESSEISIIQSFLPEQMDEMATNAAIQEVIDELSAVSLKDMGKVMGALKEKFAGKMDFSKASAKVKAKLS